MQTCLGCRSMLHAECHQELGACSTLGCAGARPTRSAETPSPPLEAVGLAVLLGWAVASVQELLLAQPALTPSDVVALALTSVVLSSALGIWLADLRGASTAIRAIPVLAYLSVGLAVSSSAIHDGVWVGAGCLLFAQLAWSAVLRSAVPRTAAPPA